MDHSEKTRLAVKGVALWIRGGNLSGRVESPSRSGYGVRCLPFRSLKGATQWKSVVSDLHGDQPLQFYDFHLRLSCYPELVSAHFCCVTDRKTNVLLVWSCATHV